MRGFGRRFGRAAASFGLPPAVFLGIIGAVVLAAGSALARTGGGQHYTGGGGGFSGGGGGGGDGLGALLYLVILYPEIGVPVAIVVVIFSVLKHVRNPDNTTRRAVKRLETFPLASPDLSAIRSKDPEFNEAGFLERVRNTELKVQQAWERGELPTVRSLLSDGLYRRLVTQLAILKRHGVRNITADHRILDARVHATESDDHFDTVHVAIHATARDADVDAALTYEQALEKAKGSPADPYVEIWSFLRRPGAKTQSSNGLLLGRCPNCGADLPSGETTRCDHCKALVNSGEYDWVLAEITQVEEWRPGSTGGVPGMVALKEGDPGFTRQGAEDRASYLFWRWIEALATGSPSPLAKVATPSLREQVAEIVENGPAALYKVAVGAVDLVACEGDSGDGRERFHVKVLWSSARSPKDLPVHQVNVLTMGRKASASKRKDAGLSHARCPECYGPLEENDSPKCGYCGATLDAGDRDWVLEAVIHPEELVLRSREGDGESTLPPRVVIPDMGNGRERTLLLMRMAAIVMADGVVTKEERKLLKTAAKRWQVPFDAVTPILTGEVEAGVMMTMRPSDPEAFLSGLISAALVDGRIDRKEERLLLDVSRNMGIKEADARKMMAEMAKG